MGGAYPPPSPENEPRHLLKSNPDHLLDLAAHVSEIETILRRPGRPGITFAPVATGPYPAPPPHNGVTETLDAAKQEFRTLYEEMKRMGVRPFG
jgi:hypothetical protein